MLEVRLLGPMELRFEGAALPVQVPARALVLLGYLLLHRDKPLQRDAVAFTFWPDMPEEEARARLRTHLHYLTARLLPRTADARETSWLLANKRTIQWNPQAPVRLDVAEFERLAANPSSAAAAADIYGGDLLAGVDEEWLEAPRTHFRERTIALLCGLVERAREAGDRASAIAFAQRLLAIDPWREDGVRALIALRHESGDRAGALQTYRDFAGRLKSELGVEPLVETTEAYERLASTESNPPAAGARNARLPTGTVTFLFTDVEGSTLRWERYPDAMPQALQKHEAILRDAVARRGGCIFKWAGDGCAAAFARAEDAVAAAVAAQRELVASDFSCVGGIAVRMAIHTGTADERNGDYYGPSVNRAARLLDVAHGGQVLLSGACEECARSGLPANIVLTDLGSHRLRDLRAPERIFQAHAPGLTAAFPELKSLDVLPHNLPAQIAPLVGRRAETAAIVELLERSRLVTLTGAGGIGKTRIALHVAAELLEAGGSWLVELDAIADPISVDGAIASVFGIRDAGATGSVLDATVATLKNKRLLLVLDNCEHVVHAAAKAVGRLLAGCPELRVLATGREPLGIAGEHVFRLPTLCVPPDRPDLTASELMEYPAAEFFVNRARAAHHAFAVDDANASAVAGVVRRLDGIPLAIELAAARVNVLTIDRLSDRLDERFKLLTGGSRTALPRHQTLHALIAWSYDLLSENERRVLRRLSVFAGGFTLDLATAACANAEIEDFGVLDVLARLVDKSLVHVEPVGYDVRYRILESTRAFAREKLVERDEESEAARGHAHACLALAERLDAAWDSLPEAEWTALAQDELDNFRTALRWLLVTKGDVAAGRRLASALRFVWYKFAPAEGGSWIAAALAGNEGSERTTLGRLHLASAQLEMLHARYREALSSASNALVLLEGSGEERTIAEAQLYAGTARGFLGSMEQAETLLRTALASFRSMQLPHRVGPALQALAMCRVMGGDVGGARPLYSEALLAYRAAGADAAAAHMALNLAELEFQAGDPVRALELAQEALASDRARRVVNSVVYDLCNVAAYLLVLERPEEAATHALEALAQAREARLDMGVSIAIQRLAAVAVLDAKQAADPAKAHQSAARLLGFVDRRLHDLGHVREYTEEQEYERAMNALRAALGSDACAGLMRDAAEWDEVRASEEAIALHSKIMESAPRR